MRRIRLPADVDEREARIYGDLLGEPATDGDYAELVDEDAELLWPDGSIAGVYRASVGDVIPEAVRLALPRVKPSSGIRSSGMPTRSRQFGSSARSVIRGKEGCTDCTLNHADPGLYAELVRLGHTASGWYAEARLDLWAGQMEWVGREIRPEWVIAGPYTSGIINLDNALPYHRDNGNVAGGWNAQVVVRQDTEGGHLVIPAWGLGFATADRSVLLLDAQRTMHGVTRIRRRRVGGFRTSVVYYSLKGLRVCGSPEEEIRRAQVKRTEREERRAGLIP